ncbi:DUF2252 domain-containing protein [Gordonia desulfuricans]|uniref:DUF2252 domain-containing protein n=1 Tax=Gordonia desulfuricans TaxID=89051 RepID=A0A7K3LU16_9ACTN|nr:MULTISPECIES: DUF2252 domain-containing protein [Gordonia]EMP12904.2 hypothetical protein ISGA_949 [Gordonia sp. NB41Y]NDK91778.1 DUF2252 domain-containing protein [Gordonia desulfuricans]WLP92614.1 DUF2252 domain-containing protein [Gordonia sp. NB41Y]
MDAPISTIDNPREHRSAAEREALGRQARERLPLSSLGDFDEESTRDPVELLLSQSATRVPELVPIRHGRMAQTPFTFYRGAALVMADDLSRTPHSGLQVQLCGDAHLSNFGLYATPERQLTFDVNDFDETYPGPFEWDVKRLAASLTIAARHNGFEPKTAKKIARACADEYRSSMAELAALGTLKSWYQHAIPTDTLEQLGPLLSPKMAKSVRKTITKAWQRDSLQATSKLTTVIDGELRFVDQPPLIVPVERLLGDDVAAIFYDEIASRYVDFRLTMEPHHQVLLDKFRVVKMARKVVGVGSVGTQAWVLLLEGKDAGDPLILQAKEAQRSVLDRYLDGPEYGNQGERVVRGQKLTQAVSDIFLGWNGGAGIDGTHRDFYLRQLRDAKGSFVVEVFDQNALAIYGRVCARVLAYGHARSGDPLAISAYLGKTDEFDRSIGRFATRYAKRNAKDHTEFVARIDAGQVPAMFDV